MLLSPLAANAGCMVDGGELFCGPPSISIRSPASGQSITTATPVTVIADAIDYWPPGSPQHTSLIYEIRLYINGTYKSVQRYSPNAEQATAQFALGTLAIGTYVLKTVVMDQQGREGSAQVTITVTGVPLPVTQTSIVATPNPVQVGLPTILTATVTGGSATGLMTFRQDGKEGHDVALVGNQASFSMTFADRSVYTIYAAYSGDSAHQGSGSSVLVTVQQRQTAVTLTSDRAVSQVNDLVTFTATVSGLSPSGTVRFKSGSTDLQTVTLSNGVATLATRFASAGSRTITAEYGGDTNNATASTGVNLRVNAPPAVTLTSPANGTILNLGSTISFVASPTDDVGIARVEYWANGALVGSTTQAPHRFDWAGQPGGSYALFVKAIDTDGVAVQSSTNPVLLNAPPVVSMGSLPSFLAPSVSTSLTLTASATDSDGTITKVEYFANGALIGSSTSAVLDYRVLWSGITAYGTYNVFARATDNTGQTTDSAVRTMVVGDNTAPVVSMSYPSSALTVNYPANLTLRAAASDGTGGVSWVTFYACEPASDGSCTYYTIGGGTLSGGEYIKEWNRESPGTYRIKAIATDTFNVTTESSPVTVTIVDTLTGAPPAVPSSDTVGTLPGDVSVDASGGAGYSISVEVPPGTAGMVPAVGLSYSSRAGTSVLAYGWSITGFSSITRCGLSHAVDKPSAAYAAGLGTASKLRVNLDQRDQFCLDGKRLILVSGTHGANATYRTEIDAGVRVQSFGSNPAKGPDRWEAWYRNGRISEFGNTADSKLEAVSKANAPWVMWNINRVRDRRSNYFTVEYQQEASRGELYPVRMRYTGNASSTGGFAPYHVVKFVYDAADRLDPLEGYVVGVPVASRKRLNKIQVVMDTAADGSGGLDVREYRLGYRLNPVNGRSLVETIQDCARLAKDANSLYQCMPATTFQYSERTEADNSFNGPGSGVWGGPDLGLTSEERTQTGKLQEAIAKVQQNAVFADFNGDGMTDVAAAVTEGAWTVCLSTGSSFSCSSTWNGLGTSRTALTGDFNGDGAADLLIPPAPTTAETGVWNICTSLKDRFSCVNWTGPTGTGQISDLDADGKDDVLITQLSGSKIFWCRSEGAGFSCSQLPTPTGEDWDALGSGMFCESGEGADPNDCKLTRDGDFDGSGRIGKFITQGNLAVDGWVHKYCQITPSGISCKGVQTAISEPVLKTAIRGPMTGQLNNDGVDGYADVVLIHMGKKYGAEQCAIVENNAGFCVNNRGPVQAEVCRSIGDGLDCRAMPTPARGSDYAFSALSDVDGDGFPDGISGGRVCQLGSAGARCDDYALNKPAGSTIDTKYADFNGDGHMDLAMHSRTTDQWTVQLGNPVTPDLLIKVTNGLGNVTRIDYDSMRNPAVYVPDTGAVYPVRDVLGGAMVVKKIYRDDGLGTGGTQNANYRYGGSRWDASRGSLGFRWLEAHDEVKNVVTRTELSQTFPCIGQKVVESQVHIPTQVELQRSTTNWTDLITANASGDNPAVHSPYVSGKVDTVRELNSGRVVLSTQLSGVLVDSFGTEWSHTKTVSSARGETFSEVSISEIENDETNWLIGQHRSVVIRRSAPGFSDVSRRKDYTYNSYGEQETETTEATDTSGALKSVLTKIRANSVAGVVAGTNIQWQELASGVSDWSEDATTRTRQLERIEYDDRYRFVVRTINSAGHATNQETDDRSGLPTLVRDPNNVGVSHIYDGFGRLLKETRADGTFSTTQLAACATSCGAAKMVSTAQQFTVNGSLLAPSVSIYWDALGRSIQWTSPGFDGRIRIGEREYDGKGNVRRKARTRFSGEAAVWTNFDYDDLGRLTTTTGPTGVSTVEYSGARTVTTNELGQKRTEESNGLGKLALSQDAYGKQTTYAYEPFGALARVTDPSSNVIAVTFDTLGRKVQLSDPDLGTWSYQINALGELRRQTDAKGQIQRLRYDGLGRVVQRLSGDQDARWVFDTAVNGIGKLAEAYTLSEATKDYQRLQEYDSIGRSLRTTERLDIDYVVETTYQAGTGRIDTQQYRRQPKGGAAGSGSGIAVSYGYNSQGYLSTLSTGGVVVWKAESMDALDRLLLQTHGNGVKTKWVYRGSDARLQYVLAGRPDSEGNPDTSVQNDTYLFDAVGNLTYRAQWNDAGGLLQESFGYDDLNRIKSSQVLGQAVREFSYDDIGNIRTKGGVGIFNYPASGLNSVRPHALTTVTGTVAGQVNPTFVYDANGNLEQGLGREVTWSSNSLPILVKKSPGTGPGTATTSAATDQFIYGPELQRVKQTATISSGTNAGITTIWYGGGVEKETRSSENLTLVRTYLAQGVILTERYLGTVADVTVPSGLSRQIRYFQKDRLGSTVAITNEVGDVVERQFYDVWGQRRNGDGSDNLAAGSKDYRFGYTGHEHLDVVGLIHMNGRVYDPLLSRFMSADPTVPDPSNGQNLNRFSYVLNNPTSYTDPSGFAQVAEAETSTSSTKKRIPGQITGIAFDNRAEKSTNSSEPPDGECDADCVRKKKGSVEVGPVSAYSVGAKDTAVKESVSKMSKAERILNTTGEDPSTCSEVRISCQEQRELYLYRVIEKAQEQGLENFDKDIAANMLGGWALRIAKVAVGSMFGTVGFEAEGGLLSKALQTCCCFSGNTLILSAAGPMPIRDVVEGTLVQSLNETSGAFELKPVVAVLLNPGRPLYRLTLRAPNGQQTDMEVTDNHPFWVEGQGWVESLKLVAGMRIGTFARIPVTVLEIASLDRTELTYNLSVADNHTYFAGDTFALVHNECVCGVASNFITHEAYKNELRAAMSKPVVSDPVLKKLINPLYRENAKVGSGSTAAAVRHELATGERVGGSFHSQKATEAIRSLGYWLKNNPAAHPSDRAAAEHLIIDMQNALKGQ